MAHENRAHTRNKAGMLGVTYLPTRNAYRASVALMGKSKYIGQFSTPEEAHAAYLLAKRQLHQGCTI